MRRRRSNLWQKVPWTLVHQTGERIPKVSPQSSYRQCTMLVAAPHQVAKMACALSWIEPNRVQREVDPPQIYLGVILRRKYLTALVNTICVKAPAPSAVGCLYDAEVLSAPVAENTL